MKDELLRVAKASALWVWNNFGKDKVVEVFDKEQEIIYFAVII